MQRDGPSAAKISIFAFSLTACALAGFLLPFSLGKPNSAYAQEVTQVCITLPGRDCQNRCISQECFDQVAREAAETERRARMTQSERDAEDTQIHNAAEAKRKAAAADQAAAAIKAQKEQEQRQAAYKASVDGEMAKFGLAETRRTEAERLKAMRDAAEKARPKPKPKREATVTCSLAIKGKSPVHWYLSRAGAIIYKEGEHPADINKQVVEVKWRAYLRSQGVAVDAAASGPYPNFANCNLLSSLTEATTLRNGQLATLRANKNIVVHEMPWVASN